MHSVLQYGITGKKPSPVRGSTAPYAYLYSRMCRQGTEGLSPFGHWQALGLLIRPKPASSRNMTRTFMLGYRIQSLWYSSFIFLRRLAPLGTPPWDASTEASLCAGHAVSSRHRHSLTMLFAPKTSQAFGAHPVLKGFSLPRLLLRTRPEFAARLHRTYSGSDLSAFFRIFRQDLLSVCAHRKLCILWIAAGYLSHFIAAHSPVPQDRHMQTALYIFVFVSFPQFDYFGVLFFRNHNRLRHHHHPI